MWSIYPELRGKRATEHWLRFATPEKKAENTKKIEENTRLLEDALRTKSGMVDLLRETIGRAETRGRITGMKEGLDTYEFGMKIEGAERSAALRAIFKYVASQRAKYEDNKRKLDVALYADKVCNYLDSLVQRGLDQPNLEVLGPPPEWKCESWIGALHENSKRTLEFLKRASADAWSEDFTLLMAWNTWGRIGEPHTRLPNKPCMEQKKEATAAERAARQRAFFAERGKANAAAREAVKEEAERWVAKYHSGEYARMKEGAKQGKSFPKKDEEAKKAVQEEAESWMAKYHPDNYDLMKAEIEAKRGKLFPKKDEKDEQ